MNTSPLKWFLSYRCFLILFIFLTSCNRKTRTLELEKERVKIVDFKIGIFNQDSIDSKQVLTDIQEASDSIHEGISALDNTLNERIYYMRTLSGQLRFLEKPLGTIQAIGYYKEGEEIVKMEYYRNGKAKCRYSLTDEGIKNGPFFCFNENGQIQLKGFFEKGISLSDSLIKFQEL